MSKESKDALRHRLLGDPQVQTMIRMRAFELYQMRGREPGHEREDWFIAEGEVLEFLIHEENSRTADTGTSAAGAKESPAEQMSQEKGGAGSGIGVWSATDPASSELAPSIGSETESASGGPAKKTRSSAKSSTTRKAKSKDETGEGSKKTTSKARSKKNGPKKG